MSSRSSYHSAKRGSLSSPKITVCIPTYNRPKELNECLASLNRQSLRKELFQVHVSDNASQANIQEIVESFDELSIIYHRQDKNVGHVENYRYLIESCQTPYCLILCDDDWCDPDFLERGLNRFEQNENIAFYSANADYRESPQSNSGVIMRPTLLKLKSESVNTYQNIFYTREEVLSMCAAGTPFFFGASIVKSEALQVSFSIILEGGFFYSSEKIIYSKLCESGDVFYEDRVATFVRWNGSNLTNKLDERSKEEEFRKSTEWVLNYGYREGIDIPRFWHLHFSHASPEKKAKLREILKRGFSGQELEAIEKGNLQVFKRFHDTHCPDSTDPLQQESAYMKSPGSSFIEHPAVEERKQVHSRQLRTKAVSTPDCHPILPTCLAVFSPHLGAISEAFITRQIQRLSPGRTVVVAQRIHDASWFSGPCLQIPFSMGSARFAPEVEAAVIKFLTEHRVTHILCQYGCFGTEIVELNARSLHLPLFVHFHAMEASEKLKNDSLVNYYRWMGQNVSGVICPSLAMKDRLERVGLPEDKLHCIPYGVDAKTIGQAHPEYFPCRFISVTQSQKSSIFLLQAFSKVIETVPGVSLDIIGTGPMQEETEQFIAQNGLRTPVHLHGSRPDRFVKALLMQSSAYVQHSIVDDQCTGDAEGLPNAILEASAAALPVVSTRPESIPEAVAHGLTGFLVEERDVDAMASHMIALARDGELRLRMGQAGRQKMLEEFTIDGQMHQLRRTLSLEGAGTVFPTREAAQTSIRPDLGTERVVIVAEAFPTVTETFILDQITGLIDRGVNLEIWASAQLPASQTQPEVERYGLMERVKYLRYPSSQEYSPEEWTHAFCLQNGIERIEQIRCFHIHFGPSFNRLAPLFAHFRDKFVVVSFHGYDATKCIESAGIGCYAFLFKRANLITTPSQYMKKHLVSKGANAAKILIHRYGVDLVRFRGPDDRPAIKPVTLISVARLVPKKGLEDSLRAFAAVAHQHDAVYKIIGEGPLARQLAELVTALGIRPKVRLEGFKSKQAIIEEMAHADILVLTSITAPDGDQEGLPVTLIEAHAMGLPVISTLHAGIPELVEHNTTGLLAPEKDVKQIALHMHRLISDRKTRITFGAKARRKVEREFDINRLNDRLLSLLGSFNPPAPRIETTTTLSSGNPDCEVMVSVLIPTHNRAHYLREAIESALHQSRQPSEIVIVDDGSTDHTPDIVRPFLSQGCRYIRKEHSGAPLTRNRAIAEARGQFIIWLDSDDVLMPDAIEAYLSTLQRVPEADVLYGDLLVCDAKLKPLGISKNSEWYGRNQELLAQMMTKCCITNPGTMIRKRCFETIGLYNTRFTRAHDYEWWSRLIKVGVFKHVDKVTVQYRLHDSQLSGDMRRADLTYEGEILLGMLARYPLQEAYPDIEWDSLPSPVAEAKAWLRAGTKLLSLRHLRGAISCLEKSHSLAPQEATAKALAEVRALRG